MAIFKSKKQGFAVFVITAVASFLSFVHVNSAFADAHKLHDVFQAGGIVFAVAALFSGYTILKMQAKDESSTP